MRMIVDGKHVDSSDSRFMEVFNPSTHETIDVVPFATAEDVEAMLTAAQRGKQSWGSMDVDARSDILTRAADIMSKNKERIAQLISTEQGKVIRMAREEAEKTQQIFRGYAQKARFMYGCVLPDSEGDMITVRREPLGVIACVIPFNFPAELFAHKVAPALAMGNSVVVKPASDTPLTDIYLVELLLEAGVPADAIQIVTGSGATIGRQIASSGKINGISVTGSTRVGTEIACCAAKNLTRVFLELGGNDAFIVFEDADINLAAAEAVNARTYNAGQVCCSAKRCIVQNSVREEFAQAVIREIQKLKVGNALSEESDIGPLINEAAAALAEEQVAAMVAQGAKVLTGGRRFNKTFFEPTVLYDVRPEMEIAKDLEVFAPVICIIGFETEEDAVRIANSSGYGLSGGVLSSDLQRATRVANQLDSGGVVAGGAGMYRTLHMPFGGHKRSGIGSEGFFNTLEEMSRTKNLVIRNLLR